MVENRDNSQENLPKNNNGLDLKSKILVVVLFVFAVVIVILWASSLKNNLNEPFEYQGQTNTNEGGGCPSGDCGGSNDEDLRNKDTDGDGLSDWEELNVYNTSPYLKDSDSDGYPDGEEVENNHDPNCPRGEECYKEEEDNGMVNNPSATTSSNQNPEDGMNFDNINSSLNLDEENLNAAPEEVQSVMQGEASVDNLREILRQAGMEEDVLDKISDDQLKEAYKETLNKQQNNQ